MLGVRASQNANGLCTPLAGSSSVCVRIFVRGPWFRISRTPSTALSRLLKRTVSARMIPPKG